jgi:hypothetical protein
MSDVHFLSSQWETACGLSRHFTLNVVNVTIWFSEVTCPVCLSSKNYDDWKKQLKIEGFYKDERRNTER